MSGRILPHVVGYMELDPEDSGCDSPGQGNEAAIYLHFPFCSHLCTYCDFDTFVGQESWIGSYVDAVLQQIRRSPRVQATSLYVGGGTPSLMSTAQATQLVAACRERFHLPSDVEATIEANPSGITLERLRGFRDAGFNRLSLGVQSADERLLRLLGRRHKAGEAATAIEMAREAGFERVSIDLLYGVPMQDLSTWQSTLEAAIGWGVDHLSCYALTVEPGTPMERGVERGTLLMPSDDTVVAMYEAAGRILGDAGYRRYEISNWARPGFESAHNLTYWRNRPYLGIGAGAAGCWQGQRYKIAPTINSYVDGVGSGRVPLQEEENIDSRRAMSDSLILGLRLGEGVSVEEFIRRHGVRPEEQFGETLQWAEGWGLLQRNGDRLRLTERGIMVSNELFSRLL